VQCIEYLFLYGGHAHEQQQHWQQQWKCSQAALSTVKVFSIAWFAAEQGREPGGSADTGRCDVVRVLTICFMLRSSISDACCITRAPG
jgi:hypothetical protein